MVKPLAGRSQQQNSYVRHPDVEAEIAAVLEWPLPEAFALAANGTLRPQTVVYLMRNCRPNRPTPAYDSLVVAFFSRLQRAGDHLTRGLSKLDRETVDGWVTDRTLHLIERDRLDIFEMSFKTGAERLYLTALARLQRQKAKELPREDLIEPGSNMTGEEAADGLALLNSTTAMPLAEARAALKETLEKLNEKERRAIFYVYHMKLTEKEAGDHLGCSDRNVRYLLESARRKALGEPKSTGGQPARKRANR